MQIKTIQNINITVLFSTPLNHLLISQAGLLNLFKTNDQQKDQHTFIEAPGLKIFMLPNQKKEIVFEAVRMLVNNKQETKPETSDIIDDFLKIMDSNAVEKNKMSAYGFNYDVIVEPESEQFKIGDLIGAKVAKIENIKSAGVSVVFEQKGIKYNLEIKPIGIGQQFLAHFNAHFNVNTLPSKQELKDGLIAQFDNLKDILEKI